MDFATASIDQLKSRITELEDLLAHQANAEHLANLAIEQRTAELGVIQAVQTGLIERLDMQQIVDVVGEQIRSIFEITGKGRDCYIALADHAAGLNYFPYRLYAGERSIEPPAPIDAGLTGRIIQSGMPLVINTDSKQHMIELGAMDPKGSTADESYDKSWVGVPMIIGDKVIGVISISDADRENAFPEPAVNLLTTLAASTGVALENARLFAESQRLLEETEARNSELAVINAVQQGLSEQLDMQAIVDIVGETIRQIFNVKDGYIALVDHATGTVQTPYLLYKGERHPSESFALGQGLTGHVISTRHALVLNEDTARRQAELGAISHIEDEEPELSWIGVPMIVGDKVVGVISLSNHEQEHAYPEAAVNLLTTLAATTGVALENARLFAETKRLLEETDQRASELAVINTVQQGLAEQLDLEGIIDSLGDTILRIFPGNSGFIAVVDHEAELVRTPFWFSEIGARIVSDPFPIGAGLTGHVIRTRQPLVINEDFERIGDELGARIVDDGTGDESDLSWMGVPMVSGDQVIGVINLANRHRENAYPLATVTLMTTLAASTAVALENARLFTKSNRLLAETEARNSELAVINAVQQGLAKKLDMKGIVEVVGDKIREVFGGKDGFVALIDYDAGLIRTPYYINGGERVETEPFPLGQGLTSIVVETRQPLILNENVSEQLIALGALTDDDVWPTRSWIGVPMISGDKVVGVLSVADPHDEHAFQESAVSLLTTLAASTGVALENARLFDESNRLLEETDRRASELAVINAVQQGLAEQLDMQGIVDVVGDKILEIFAGKDGYIALVDHEVGMIHMPYFIGGGKRLESEPMSLGTGLTGIVIANRQPLVINENAVARMHELGAIWVDDGVEEISTKSWVGVPMLAGDKVVGVISLSDEKQENAFPDSVVNLLNTLAASTGVALDGARLFAESNRLLEETNLRAAELSTVNVVSQAVASELDLDALIQLTGEHVRQIFNPDMAYLAILDRELNLIHFPYAFGETLDEMTFGEGLASRIIRERAPLLINEDVAGLHETLSIQQVGTLARSYLGVPIIAGDEAIGVLSVQTETREGNFTEHDSRLLSTIASNVGAAIANARLFRQTQRQAGEMAALAEIGQEVSATLDTDAVLEMIAERASEVLRTANVAVYLAEPDGTLPARVAMGRDADALRNASIRIGQGIVGSVARTGIAEIVNDPLLDSRVMVVPGTGDDNDEALLVAPLVFQDRVSGVLAVWRVKSDSGLFTQSDLEFINGLSRHAAIAVENARMFKAIMDTQAAAEQANLAKSTFLANMSHELRTPLNAIIGFTRIVKRQGAALLPEKQLENLERVLVSAEHLLGLINTILDIGKIEAGRMDVQITTVSMPGLLDVVVATTQPLLRPGVVLKTELDAELAPISSDADKIKQVLLNLLSNAAKFTETGSITLRAEQHENSIAVSVQDSGIGIPAEAFEKVFEEFQQADSSTTRKYGGTGLGLSISRHLARLLGGDLTLQSTVGIGTAFTLELPIKYGESAAADHAAIAPQRTEPLAQPGDKSTQPVIMAVDDDPDAIYLLQETLADSNYRVVAVNDSREAVRRAKEIRPMAVTLDIMMPGKDGWQVLHDLKSDPETQSIPVIMLTIVDKKALGYRLGAHEYLVKPIDREALLRALDAVPGGAGPEANRLLVVDDDPGVLEMVRQMLEGTKFTVETAGGGFAALEQIGRNRPDAILLDLIMPGIDGFSVIEELHRDPELRAIPVLVFTAKDLTNQEASLLSSSADRVIRKQGIAAPVLIQHLEEALRKSAPVASSNGAED